MTLSRFCDLGVRRASLKFATSSGAQTWGRHGVPKFNKG